MKDNSTKHECTECGWQGIDEERIEREDCNDTGFNVLACPNCDNTSFYLTKQST